MRPVIVILAAGLGTRMKSELAKALHPLAGRPLVRHVLDAARGADPERVVVVVGHQAEAVAAAVAGPDVVTAIQREQLGTGHALLQAREVAGAPHGPVVVLCADTPLITAGTLRELVDVHRRARAVVTLVTVTVPDPAGYGRIIRDRSGVKKIVEEKDATAAQRTITEVNAGIYCFDGSFLWDALSRIGRDNAQGEYYLPDTVSLARKLRRRVATFSAATPEEVMGVNSRAELGRAEKVLQKRINQRWMLEGVTLIDPDAVSIGPDVRIGPDTTLYPNVRLEGTTAVGRGCTLYPGSRIVDSSIHDYVTVKDCCVIEGSEVRTGASVGPFAHLRPGAIVGPKAKVGNFVEVKNSEIGEGSKANHLAYIGDATVGQDVNIGAGVITCNYDGFAKHRTVIGDRVFVGSDAQLVAPVAIGAGAVIAAGATITKDVPADALAISRAPQENRLGVAARRRKLKLKNDRNLNQQAPNSK